jgi:uncharacterized protein with PQ loop repeat
MLSVLAWLAAGLSVARMLPQFVALWSTRDTGGVSFATLSIASSGSMLWVGWSAAAGEWASFCASLLGCVFPLASAAAFWRASREARLVAAIAVLVVVSGVVGWLYPSLSGWLGVALSSTLALPQLWSSVTAGDLSGVSRPTWVLVAATAATWGVYGIGVRQWVLVIPSAVNFPAALAILARVTSARRRDATPTPEP